MNEGFKGKTVLITGAGGALGSAVAQALTKRGADLVLADVNAAALDAVSAACPGAKTMVLDMTAAAAVEGLAVFARDAFGRPVEKLVAAAGVLGPMRPLVDVTEEEYDRIFEVNVKALWRLSRLIVPQMREIGRGSVVLFSSTAGLQASKALSLYSVSKAAVTMLTRNFALNHAAENIRFNCVCPGTIESPMAETNVAFASGEAEQAKRRAEIIAAHPMARLGLPEEVAAAVVFLLDDTAGFITGTAVPVDGGRLA